MARTAIVARHTIKRTRVIDDYERAKNDWYVEPVWATELLFRTIQFDSVYDPCCGGGNILQAAANCGIPLSVINGTDIKRRDGFLRINEMDFFKFTQRMPAVNIVMNPPYELAEEFILHALPLTDQKVAAIVNIKFLASQGRYDRLFSVTPPQQILILSRRPSMPPGGGDIPAKGGTADYCWLVWDKQEDPATGTHTRWVK